LLPIAICSLAKLPERRTKRRQPAFREVEKWRCLVPGKALLPDIKIVLTLLSKFSRMHRSRSNECK
jgi:hypothetical protein